MSFRPIYAELADELICGIQNGTFPVGALLPTEVEIARERQLSRSTVRAALNRLVTLGLVTRQKGVGTRVASSVGHSSYDASTTSIEASTAASISASATGSEKVMLPSTRSKTSFRSASEASGSFEKCSRSSGV